MYAAAVRTFPLSAERMSAPAAARQDPGMGMRRADQKKRSGHGKTITDKTDGKGELYGRP